MHLFDTGSSTLRGGGFFGPLGTLERCSICGQHQSHPVHRCVHCYHHDELEPLGADPYKVCSRCLHVYRNEAELVDLYNSTAQPFMMAELERGDQVAFCQYCMHNF